MLNIGYIIPLICFWHTITNEISKYKHLDISNNINYTKLTYTKSK